MSSTAGQALWMPDNQQKDSYALQSCLPDSAQSFKVFSPSFKLPKCDDSIKKLDVNFAAKPGFGSGPMLLPITSILSGSDFGMQSLRSCRLVADQLCKSRKIKDNHQCNKIQKKLKHGLQ